MLNGMINIYKQKGFTSHDVVAKARGILRERKIGHTGTLDPEAEGVLPICIGKATKLVPYLSKADKCYEAEVILGAYTTTEDATGEIVEAFDVNVSKEQVEKVIQSFAGDYSQVPPMYSALKMNGVKLYELARQGIVVERPARHVKIHEITLLEWYDEKRFKIRVHCSKGTYIRTLCTDIGKKLGCGAHMGYLLRTQVGQFHLENSLTLKQLEQAKEDIQPYLTTIESFFENYPKLKINAAGEKFLKNGNPLSLNMVEAFDETMKKDFVRIYNMQDEFSALYKWQESKNSLQVEKMFYHE